MSQAALAVLGAGPAGVAAALEADALGLSVVLLDEAPAAGGHTRFYSVHRGYGLTPDAIPEPPAGDRYVLIGPPDAPAPKTDEQDGEPLGSRPDSF